MEDKWFFYLTLSLALLVITSSWGLYTRESAGPGFMVSLTSSRSFTAGSARNRLDEVLLKAKSR